MSKNNFINEGSLVVTLNTDAFVNVATTGSPLEATYTIQDDDNPPNIQFTNATGTMAEVDGTANVDYLTIDVDKTIGVGTVTRLYFEGFTNQDAPHHM